MLTQHSPFLDVDLRSYLYFPILFFLLTSLLDVASAT